jgi:hypothetical protein
MALGTTFSNKVTAVQLTTLRRVITAYTSPVIRGFFHLMAKLIHMQFAEQSTLETRHCLQFWLDACSTALQNLFVMMAKSAQVLPVCGSEALKPGISPRLTELDKLRRKSFENIFCTVCYLPQLQLRASRGQLQECSMHV